MISIKQWKKNKNDRIEVYTRESRSRFRIEHAKMHIVFIKELVDEWTDEIRKCNLQVFLDVLDQF